MFSKIFSIFLLLTVVIQGCKSNKKERYILNVENINVNITNNLRGLSVVSDKVVWASGTRGVFLKTRDGGKTWKTDTIDGASELDFRSIEAFDENTAIVVSAGCPASIYITSNGGKRWVLVWKDDNPAIFLDAIAFWNRKEGLVMGDPVEGKLFMLKTSDGGQSWLQILPENIPQSKKIEGGFAASGTCLTVGGKKHAWAGTGGDSARAYYTQDAGASWQVVNTPILSGSPMMGIYSLSFKNNNEGIAVGGEWNVKTPQQSKAFTRDGGRTWSTGTGADTYCSGSCFVKEDIYLACGQSGIDLSVDGGENWEHINDLHLYGLAFEKLGSTGFGTGPSGRLVKLSLEK